MVKDSLKHAYGKETHMPDPPTRCPSHTRTISRALTPRIAATRHQGNKTLGHCSRQQDIRAIRFCTLRDTGTLFRLNPDPFRAIRMSECKSHSLHEKENYTHSVSSHGKQTKRPREHHHIKYIKDFAIITYIRNRMLATQLPCNIFYLSSLH